MTTLKTIEVSATGGILVVDDNDINRDICAINLEQLDLPLHFAANGKEGLNMASEVQPDLILLDIMMPEMDGFDMLNALRKSERLADIPVLMLTAKAETENIVKALELGANDYLKKPFAEEEMVARVRTLLNNRYLERQVKQDIADGAAIQAKFLTDSAATTSLLHDAGIHVELYNKPCRTVSGDFFYAFRNHQSINFFIGDSSGHGLSAALISMRILGFLQRLGKYPYSPAQFLKLLNRDICGLLPSGKFVAGACLSFTESSCTLSNAAQPYVLLEDKDGLHEIVIDGFPLGIDEAVEYQETQFSFQPGDRIFLFTDGIPELSDSRETIYGIDRLKKMICSVQPESGCDDVVRAVVKDIERFTAEHPVDDDLTLIVLEKQ